MAVSDRAPGVGQRVDDSFASPSRVLGRYIDQGGRRWFCVQRTIDGYGESISCDSDDGWFTAASPATFAAWRWHPEALTGRGVKLSPQPDGASSASQSQMAAQPNGPNQALIPTPSVEEDGHE